MLSVQNLLLDILTFLTSFVGLSLFKSILDNLSKNNQSSINNYLFILLTASSMFILKIDNSIVAILICTAFYKTNYNQNILKCFLTSSVYWFLIYRLIEYLSLHLVFDVNYNYVTQKFYMNENTIIIECMIIQNAIMLVMFHLCSQIRRFQIFRNTRKKITYPLIFIPIAINILIMIVIFRIIAIDKNLSVSYTAILVITPILMYIYYAYIFYMMKINIHSHKLDYENKMLKDNILRECNHYLEINNEKDKVRSLYHDMKNHLICIRYLCETENRNKVLEYIDSMEDNISNYNQLNQEFNTGSMIVDSILRVKKSKCLEKDIDFSVGMDFSKSEFIDMVDTCTIFSNLIDNAIEACDKITDSDVSKKIKLKTRYINGFLVILIENTKVNEIKQKKNLFLTNKKNSYMHGLGLNNVKKTVEKYSGEVDVDYDENTFTVKIMIPYKNHISY